MRKKKKKYKFYLFLILFILVSAIIYILYQYRQSHDKIEDYGEMVLLQFTTTVLTHAKQEVFSQSYDDELIKVTRKTDGSIESIDYDMILAMSLSDQIMVQAEGDINAILAGNYMAKDNSKYEQNMENIANRKGVVGYLPLATILEEPLLSFTNLEIPVKFESFALVFAKVSTNVESYGINHLKIELSIDVRLTQKMVLPLYSDIRVIEYSFPIALKIVYGELPQHFYGVVQGGS